jgi:hypothetical protein
MSHQPDWGAPQQPYPPTPQQRRKSIAAKISGLSCLGVMALCLLIALIAVVALDSDRGDTGSGEVPDGSVAEKPAERAASAFADWGRAAGTAW